MTKILKLCLPFCDTSVHALAIIPNEVKANSIAAFSHGYTSHKGSILNWSLKLADNHMASIVFDLPGHYLGSFNEVHSFDEFKFHTSDLFKSAIESLLKELKNEVNNIILGGHSLGGFLSIKALSHDYFSKFKNTQAITVGVGMPKAKTKHVLQSPFFESMLRQRASLVSPALNPEVMFDWIAEEKENINTQGKSILLLTGNDDLISPPENIEYFAKILMTKNNLVTVEVKNSLPHNTPELASTHLKNYIKSQGLL